MLRTHALALALVAVAATAVAGEDHERLLAKAKLGIGDAIERAAKAVGEGTPFHAELEEDEGKVVWSIDLARGRKTVNVVLDAATGAVVEKQVEDEDHSASVAASKTSLVDAIAKALARCPGKAVEAELESGRPAIEVKVFAGGKLVKVKVDATSGEPLVAPPDEGDGPAFTDRFPVEEGELVSRGSNRYFVLEPGHVLVLEGKDEGEDARLTITVLDETVKIDGVETRVVEEREEKGGALVEVSRNFFAISKRTGDVYYFGEDVDIYKGGKIVSHGGAWRSGEKGARFGLMMPATPLLGARFHQEVAPGVAMDRAEVLRLDGTLETAAGKLEGCLVIEETTPLEKGRERKVHAPGIGLVKDGHLKLVRHGGGAKFR